MFQYIFIGIITPIQNMKKRIYHGSENDLGLSVGEYRAFMRAHGAERLSATRLGPVEEGEPCIHYFDRELVTVIRCGYYHEGNGYDKKSFKGTNIDLRGPEEGIREIEKLILDEEKKSKFRR